MNEGNQRRMQRLSTRVIAAFGLVALVRAASAAPATFPEVPSDGHASFSSTSFRVSALLVHGDTIYVGGNFRVSQGGVSKTNLAAFDLSGNLRAGFTASPNGSVLALATDGASLFVGGEFTRLGLKRRLAALDLATGAVKRPFSAHVDGVLDAESPSGVRALAVLSDASTTPPTVRLLVGGNFTQIDSVTDNRAGLAALNPETGDLDPAFDQGVQGGYVDALLASPNALYVGGSFTQIQEKTASFAALQPSGALRNTFATGGQPVLDIDLDPVSNRLFAGVGGGANRVMAFSASGDNRGNAQWQGPRVGGDVQAVHYYAGNVYFGFHDGLFAEPDPYKLAALDANTGALERDAEHAGLGCDGSAELVGNCWLPTLDSTQGQGFFGTWAITHFENPTTRQASLFVGGDFTQIGMVTNSRRFAIFQQLPSTSAALP
jgi:outer membrane protein assembly factor BamB